MMWITEIARGEVPGVGYRYFVTGCARAAGVTGYVRNQPDGSVRMVKA
ncbi:MAG: acylphosphatase [Methanomicrobiales archaeon]